ncbi:HRDC domain-containing protein, partial [Bacillus subtilis]
FAALRAERKALADEQGIPPYLIFSDKTLREMAAVAPQSLETLATISGVGEHKLSKYGEAFLKTLTQFEKQENAGLPLDKAQSTGHKRVSREEVIKHFEAGQAPAQIAATLGFSEQTIVKHLIAAEKNNETTGVANLVEKEKAALIRQAIKEVGSSYLKPIKEHAGDGVSYT